MHSCAYTLEGDMRYEYDDDDYDDGGGGDDDDDAVWVTTP